MKPGPAPKPTKDLHSWRAKRRPHEPRLPIELLEPPADISRAGRQYWAELAQQLFDAGLSTRLDAPAMARICDCRAEIAAAQAAIDDEGMVVTSKAGAPYQHPAVGILHTARRQLLRLEQEFGMSPSSRTRVEASDKPDGELVNGKARFVRPRKKVAADT